MSKENEIRNFLISYECNNELKNRSCAYIIFVKWK